MLATTVIGVHSTVNLPEWGKWRESGLTESLPRNDYGAFIDHLCG